ncbi:MAG: molybdenum cofactor guanylyltransferase [Melioribacteraceae bacterium]|nr:MAG: molybdenum cofactor guanylyltransferase [Melioribacteraceae bacterium]
MHNKINGIILSGGKSSRMGEDKALLKVGTRTIIEIMIDKLKPFCNEIIISADETEKYSQFGYKVVPDKFKNGGPLAGIYSSLIESNTEKNFIISCDLPLVSSEVIEKLINCNSTKEIILPVTNGKYHQLCGVYSKSVLEKSESILNTEEEKRREGEGENWRKGEEEKWRKKRNTSVKKLLEVSQVEFVDLTSISGKNEFLNMNTVEDFELIKKMFE